MAVTYTSPHHSPEDPGGLIGEALGLGEAFRGPAEDLLLSWTLRLPDELPVALAARRLIERYGLERREPPDGPAGRLVVLLQEAANTREGLRPRRRGGWRGRRRQ